MRQFTKRMLPVLIAFFIGLYSISAFAYTGEVDTNDNIQISDTLINGRGNIHITRDITDYTLYYECLKMDSDVYQKIKKLKAQLQLIQYFSIYEREQTDANHAVYEAAQESYKNLYGQNFFSLSEEQADKNIAEIHSLLPDYVDAWTKTDNNTINLDLSSFSGTIDCVIWAKLQTKEGKIIYDAEVFEITGTKSEETEQVSNLIDPNDNIKIGKDLNSGIGKIEVTRDITDYKLYYQLVETDDELYSKIKKLKDQLDLIQYFSIYEMTKKTVDHDVYEAAQDNYKSLYGDYFTDLNDEQAKKNLAEINNLLPKYGETWQLAADNTFSMNLSSFTGNRKYTLWVQVEKADGSKIYDAEIFSVTGTKQETTPSTEWVIDPNDNIKIGRDLTNGQTGTIEVTRDISDYKLYYQWVEMDEALYKQIKQLEDQLQLIQYFRIYEMSKDLKDHDVYEAAEEQYKSIYGEYFLNLTEAQADENIAKIKSLFPKYAENWVETTNKTFTMDLSSFSGTKYFTLWAKVEKTDGSIIYEAEIFSLTGTKKEDEEKKDDPDEKKDDEKKDDEKTDDEKKDEEKKDDEKKDEEKKDDEKKAEEKKDSEEKKETEQKTSNESKTQEEKKTSTSNPSTTNEKTEEKSVKADNTSTNSVLPYTGVDKKTAIIEVVILAGMVSLLVVAIINYRKML